MSKDHDLIQDTDDYMILLNAAEAEEPFSQLIYDLASRYPSLKLHELYKLATEKLEKFLENQVLEIVKIQYHRWDDLVQTEHLTLEQSLHLLHKPELWDRESESNDVVHRMWTTELGHSVLDEYEKRLK